MTATNTTPLDPATVQRCIDALKGSGVYHKEWKRELNRYTELVETWTYTTHPMDILKQLLPPPEKSEAEKLVDEWRDSSTWSNDSDADFDIDDLESLAQFILDKQKPADVKSFLEKYNEPWMHWSGSKWVVGATSDKQFLKNDIADRRWFPVERTVFGVAKRNMQSGDVVTSADVIASGVASVSEPTPVPVSEPQPQYVFGPWITPADDQTPDFQIGWEYQMRSSRTGEINPDIQQFRCRHNSIDTDYRVRFEVGKWYDWTGGDCPVLPETLVDVRHRDGWSNAACNAACDWDWLRAGRRGRDPENDIIAFRVVQP